MLQTRRSLKQKKNALFHVDLCAGMIKTRDDNGQSVDLYAKWREVVPDK